MSGLSQKGGVPLTPAQLKSQQIAIQSAQKNASFWFPIQQHFSAKLQSEAPSKKDMERGEAAGLVTTQAKQAMGQTLDKDTATGAAPGSGKYVMDTAHGTANTAKATTQGLTEATASADSAYVKGLEQVLSMGRKDQQVAQQGLATAAQEQEQEIGAQQAGQAQTAQGEAQVAGLIVAMA